MHINSHHFDRRFIHTISDDFRKLLYGCVIAHLPFTIHECLFLNQFVLLDCLYMYTYLIYSNTYLKSYNFVHDPMNTIKMTYNCIDTMNYEYKIKHNSDH